MYRYYTFTTIYISPAFIPINFTYQTIIYILYNILQYRVSSPASTNNLREKIEKTLITKKKPSAERLNGQWRKKTKVRKERK